MTFKLKLPPGFYRNGTEYQSAGRYRDGDLVRWYAGAARPIGGWTQRYDLGLNANVGPLWGDGFATEAFRSGVVIGNEAAGLDLYLGTNKKIYFVANTNAVSDVTPVGFVAQAKSTSFPTGYGNYRYGFGQYGTARPRPQGRIPNVFSWGFAEWGFWPMAVAREIDPLPVYIKKDTDATFVPVAGSPEGAFDVIVTDERICMTLGKKTDYRLVEWSDQEDYEEWTPDITNQAGFQRLAGAGKLVCGVKVLNQVLILGENDAFSCQYIGPPYVYGFNRVGSRCGIIGPEAVAATETFAAWIGSNSFWIFDGTVRQLPCDVIDFYLANANQNQRSKTNAFTIADFSEVWWLYQSKNSPTNDCDSYIVYNHELKCWYTGTISRSVGIDADPLTYVFMGGTSGTMYDHDVPSAGRDNRVPFVETGPLEMENGERLMAISYVYPDGETQGDIAMQLSVRDMPQEPVRATFNFTLLNPTSTVGVMGRDIRMKLYGTLVDPNWKIGDFRVLPAKVPTAMR